MFGTLVSRAIDVMHLGNDRVICAYELDGVIIDPGPGSTVDTLLEALGDTVPRVLLLTHVHMDHAGAAGTLCQRFPELVVYVHELGAPHMADPTKLLESAGKLYGDGMERLWGSFEPVPEDRLRTLIGTEEVEGFQVVHTPGHASHHVSFFHLESGDAYVGDVAGVRIPPFDFTTMPTVPPELDVEAWLDSIGIVAAWNPKALCLTHFGRETDVEDQLHRARTALLEQTDWARERREEEFTRRLDARIGEELDSEAAESLLQVCPTWLLWQGLERYWRKRAERESAA
jgi:glyoxylase-like metal-dependent hydrolase (beta-lactamase superfamily II)